MNLLKHTLLIAALLPGPLGAEPTPLVTPPVLADPLVEALPTLQSKFPDFATLNFKPTDHLADLIARSNGKLSLVTPSVFAGSAILKAPISLTDNVLYWRLSSFTPEKTWLDVGGQLQQLAPTTTGLVLDLRSNLAPDDYRGAAQILLFFAPGDRSLFGYTIHSGIDTDLGVRPEGGQYSFHVPIVVLVNNQTTGAAEALATCLKADGALIVGRATAGRIGLFEEQKLASGQVLRYFVSPITPEPEPKTVFKVPQHPLLWNQPLVPDIALNVNDRAEKAALGLIRDNHISEVIEESVERHRLSEASLVKGQDPELDDYLATLEKGPVLLSLPVVHDIVLISALDSLRAIRLSETPSTTESTATAKVSPPASASSVQ